MFPHNPKWTPPTPRYPYDQQMSILHAVVRALPNEERNVAAKMNQLLKGKLHKLLPNFFEDLQIQEQKEKAQMALEQPAQSSTASSSTTIQPTTTTTKAPTQPKGQEKSKGSTTSD